MILFSWLFILISLMYFLTSQRPVFFSQERIGRDGQPFILHKFRTLKSDGILAERKFWWGSFLRFTSLDELPQLFNVLNGDMSLIGPRPLPTEYLPLFSPEQKRRHDVLPGITGWAQVNGRNSVSWQEKFKFDLEYVQNVSFPFDLKILFKTIVLLMSFKKDTSLLEGKFTGNHGA
jgi:lipopolysaccharide/colanic/teichoic acid biosynthesis glycosyltransferase